MLSENACCSIWVKNQTVFIRSKHKHKLVKMGINTLKEDPSCKCDSKLRHVFMGRSIITECKANSLLISHDWTQTIFLDDEEIFTDPTKFQLQPFIRKLVFLWVLFCGIWIFLRALILVWRLECKTMGIWLLNLESIQTCWKSSTSQHTQCARLLCCPNLNQT